MLYRFQVSYHISGNSRKRKCNPKDREIKNKSKLMSSENNIDCHVHVKDKIQKKHEWEWPATVTCHTLSNTLSFCHKTSRNGKTWTCCCKRRRSPKSQEDKHKKTNKNQNSKRGRKAREDRELQEHNPLRALWALTIFSLRIQTPLKHFILKIPKVEIPSRNLDLQFYEIAKKSPKNFGGNSPNLMRVTKCQTITFIMSSSHTSGS